MNRRLDFFAWKSWRNALWPLALGTAVGCTAVAMAELEMRWVFYLCAGLFFLLAFFTIPRKEEVLFGAFFLALQVDIYLRPFFGAGGSAGLEFPLVSLVGIALFAWCLLRWPLKERRRLVLAGSLKWPALTLLAATALSFMLITSAHYRSLDRCLTELQLFGVYWMTLTVVRSERDVKRVLMLMFATLAIQSLIYFIESSMHVTFTLTGEAIPLGETPRPGGTVSYNPAGYTSFVMPILLIAIAFFVVRRPGLKVPLLPLLILAGAASIGLSYTRAAWIGLGIGIILICILAKRSGRLRIGRVAIIAFATGVVMVTLAPALLARVTGAYASESTLEERWNLILIALNVIRSHPIIGVGPGLYDEVFKQYLPPGLGGTWLAGVHNEFLLRAAETGIIGGVAFVWLIIAAYRCAGRVLRANHDILSVTAIGWIAAITALVWQMCWVPWRGFSYNAIFWMFLGLMDACDRMVRPATRDQAFPSGPSHVRSDSGGVPPTFGG